MAAWLVNPAMYPRGNAGSEGRWQHSSTTLGCFTVAIWTLGVGGDNASPFLDGKLQCGFKEAPFTFLQVSDICELCHSSWQCIPLSSFLSARVGNSSDQETGLELFMYLIPLPTPLPQGVCFPVSLSLPYVVWRHSL